MPLANIFPRAAIAALVLCALADGFTTVNAQDALNPLPLRGQFRDAALDTAGGVLWIAAYDGDNVIRLQWPDMKVGEAIPVGEGPASLALSADGNRLAVVNRLEGSVSLIDTASLSVYATIDCGVGAHDISALPGGGFAVSNGFDDSLTVIDAVSGVASARLVTPASVPGPIAASEALLAVAAQEPHELLLYSGGSASPRRRLSLEHPPLDVAPLTGGRFALLTTDELLIVDGNSGRATQQAAASGISLSTAAGAIHLLTQNELISYDAALRVQSRVAVPERGWSAVSEGRFTAVLTPGTKQLYTSLRADTVDVATIQPPAAESPAESGIRVVEADAVAEAPEETVEPEPITPADPVPAAAPAAPVEVAPEPEPEPETTVEPVVAEPPAGIAPVDAPESESPAEAIPVVEEAEPLPPAEPFIPLVTDDPPLDPGPEAAPAQEVEMTPRMQRREERKRRRAERVSRVPLDQRRPDPLSLGGTEPRAPDLGPPSSSPLDRPGGASFRDALAGGLSLRPGEGGFQIPDTTKPLENVSADDGRFSLDGKQAEWSGNVRLELDDTQVATDNLEQDMTAGIFEARGNVDIRQGETTLTADRLRYELPPEPEETDSPDVLAGGTEAAAPRGGMLEADHIHMVEPGRELQAEYIRYDAMTESGEVTEAHGHAGSLYFYAKKLTLTGPESGEGEDVWVTTCNHPTPHYRVRLSSARIEQGQMSLGTDARLQLGKADTPVYVPKLSSRSGGSGRDFSIDFDSGRLSEIGYFANLGIWTDLSPNVSAALRLLPTQKEGVGFGIDARYDFMDSPASNLFRSRGELRTLYTTEDRGYTEFYHRQELTTNTVLLGQYEQWYDRDFVKDFFYDIYRDRTGPRTFLNITTTRERSIFTASASASTHDFTRETEKLPEFTYHVLERPIAENLYFTFDTYNGYYERSRDEQSRSARTVNIARLTYDWDVAEGLNIAPFVEGDLSLYSRTLDDEESDYRLTATAGVTAQSRFQKAYGGVLGFSGFKHVVMPSVTWSYRPEAALESENTPLFDALDAVPGRSRIESKIDNLVFGQDAETGETWQVARVSLYHGNDLQNENEKSHDYEIEFDIRPRPWWGFQAVAEHHDVELRRDPIRFFPFFPVQPLRNEIRERLIRRFGDENDLAPPEGDFTRVLSYFYYDDAPLGGHLNGRIGFAYTETESAVFNREILYGLGYKLSDKWGVAFEHRYDLERGELARQTYEIRRRLHCWDASFQFRDRPSGFDVRFQLSLAAFPGTKIKF